MSYIDDHAPSPVNNADVPPTTTNLLRSFVANGLAASVAKTRHLPRSVDGETKREARQRMAVWLEGFYEMTAAHDLYLALDALRQIDPTKADEVSARIVLGYEAGDSYGEWLWQWCNDAGLDADAICAEAEQWEDDFEATADKPARPAHTA